MKRFRLTLVLLSISWGLIGCSGDDNPSNPPDDELVQLTCVECHTDQDVLVALATEPPETGGESGEG